MRSCSKGQVTGVESRGRCWRGCWRRWRRGGARPRGPRGRSAAARAAARVRGAGAGARLSGMVAALMRTRTVQGRWLAFAGLLACSHPPGSAASHDAAPQAPAAASEAPGDATPVAGAAVLQAVAVKPAEPPPVEVAADADAPVTRVRGRGARRVAARGVPGDPRGPGAAGADPQLALLDLERALAPPVARAAARDRRGVPRGRVGPELFVGGVGPLAAAGADGLRRSDRRPAPRVQGGVRRGRHARGVPDAVGQDEGGGAARDWSRRRTRIRRSARRRRAR
jgi:hypothetical protein